MVNGKISIVACILANGLVAMLFIVSLLSIVVTAAPTLSNSGGGNWQYYKEITVKENSGSGLTDYQVLVQLSSSNFPTNARSDGADIRFTDVSGNELSYWIEGWDYAGKSAKIWVNVPSVSAGASVAIKMYYGNPSAGSSSNSDITFDFFDDFNNDLSKWNNFGGTGLIIENGRLKIFPGNTNNPYIKTFRTFNRGIIIEVDAETSVSSKGDFSNIVGYGLNYGNCGVSPDTGAFVTAWYGNDKWGIWDQCADTSGSNLVSASFSTNHIYRFKLYVKQNEYYADIDDGKITITRPGIHTNKEVTLGIEAHGTIYATTYFDNVRVRKYASPEPSVSVGAGAPNVVENFTFAHITDVHIGYYLDSSGMNESVSRFTDTLQAVKSAKPDRLLITGDLVENDDKDFFIAFKNLLRGIAIPVNTTPGNHDRRDNAYVFGNNLLDYNNYIKPISNPYTRDNNYSFDYKGYRFIGLDSGADDSSYPDTTPEASGLSDDQIIRLRDEFYNSAPKIVFMHHPVMSPITLWAMLDPDGAPGGNDGTITTNRWNFINYTRDSNVQLVLTGHSHNDSIFDLSGDSVDNNSLNRPLFIQTRSATKDENGGPGYRIIEFKDGKANPYNSAPIPRFERNSSALTLKNIYLAQFGLHAYDSLKRHTGMIGCSDDFELGIPDSYYTGNYGGKSFTPEVIVGYSNDTVIGTEITEFKIFSICKPFVSNAVKSVSSIQTPPSENISFNQTIEKQNDRFTTEINFYNINITTSSTATVNISNIIYKMELDLNGDGTTDKTINPDSIDTILAQPQNNIDVITYNGAGIINLITGSGNFIKASSLNPLLLTGIPPYKFPYGIFGFNISGLNRGQTIGITITLPSNISSAAQYWKYGSTPDTLLPHWYQIPLGSNDGDNVITIQLQDGGVGDDDLTANGIILDAGGPAIPIAGKVTGEGWITSPVTLAPKNNNKATFEFTASYAKGEPKGSIEYTDHAAGVKFHGTVTTLSVDKEANTAAFSGIAEINGAKYAYTVTAVDNGEHGKTDTFSINIPAISYISSGTVGGGNIQIHKDKIEDLDEVEDMDERD